MSISNCNKYFFSLLFGILILTGCEKNRTQIESDAIAFGVVGSDLSVSTRAALSAADLNGSPIYVFAIRNNITDVFTGTPITRDSENGLWYPSTNVLWQSGTYTFRGVASSEDISSISTGAYTGTVSSPGIEAFNSGLSFRVNQPTSYNESAMIDFVLSHTFNVSNGSSKPLVKFEMEHSMPAVEIYVLKSPLMYSSCIESLTLEGIFSSGTMTCSSPVVYGTPGVNIWSTSLSGDKSAVYSLSGTLADQVPITDDASTTAAKMKIITMPQQLSPDAKLSISYWVNEKHSASDPDNYVSYSEVFNLYDYSPQNWNAAHRIIYTLTIDTSISLSGVITEWKNVDFIEGTILPAI